MNPLINGAKTLQNRAFCNVFGLLCNVFRPKRNVFEPKCNVFGLKCNVFSSKCNVFEPVCNVFGFNIGDTDSIAQQKRLPFQTASSDKLTCRNIYAATGS